MKHSIRWLLVAGGVLAAGIGGAIAIRAHMLPCGWFDRGSGCESSVRLDIQALGFVRGTEHVNENAFDLSSGGDVVLLGLDGIRSRAEGERHSSILALFDADNGDLIRVVREIEGEIYESTPTSRFVNAAMSLDGQLTASVSESVFGFDVSVQNTETGDSVWEQRSERDFCSGQFDFSTDNRFLGCGSERIQLDDGTRLDVEGVGGPIDSPLLGEVGGGGWSTAPDGTEVWELEGDPTGLVRELTRPSGESIQFERAFGGDLLFSPDSQWLLETQRDVDRNLGQVAIWSSDAELMNDFISRPFVGRAWSRDAQYFALLSDDFRLQTFRMSTATAD